MQIREAKAGDLPHILAIYNTAIAETTAVYEDDPETLADRRTWWHARVVAGFPVLVAADETGVLGFASFGAFRDRPGYRHTVEHSVFVIPECHGQGVGRALMTELFARATGMSIHTMVGAIDSENTGGIAFHEKMGFEHAGTLPEAGRKFDRWLDLVFMTRGLGPE